MIFPYWYVYVYNPKLFSMVNGLKIKFLQLQSQRSINVCCCNASSFRHDFINIGHLIQRHFINLNIVLTQNIAHLTVYSSPRTRNFLLPPHRYYNPSNFTPN